MVFLNMDKNSILKEAQKYVTKGQIDKAIAEYEKLFDQPDGNIFNTVGDLYLKKGDKVKAAEVYRKAALFFKEDGFYDKAKAVYKKLLNINPHDLNALISFGELNEEKKLYPEAIKYYLAAAEILAREKRKSELVDLYNRILNLSPSNLQLRIKVADIFLREGIIDEAAKHYSYAGKYYEESGESEMAIDFYKKAISINPADKVANLGISELLIKKGDLRTGKEYLKRLVESDPSNIDLLEKYIDILIKTGEDATGVVERFVSISPENINARKLLAKLYINKGDRSGAWNIIEPILDEFISYGDGDVIDILNELKEISPVECMRRLVVFYKKIGDTEKAFQEIVNLGDYYSSEGLTEDAISCYKEAKMMNPNDPYVDAKLMELGESQQVTSEEVGIAEEEKSVEEIMQEAEIFLKFGVYEEARKRLETLKARYPENIDVHQKLKQLYIETDDREMAVTECLIIAELLKMDGRISEVEDILNEAFSMSPDDPRLKGRRITSEGTIEEPQVEERPVTYREYSKEEYVDTFNEADFYEKQGLIDEALKIYRKLLDIFPGDRELIAKIEFLSEKEKTEVERIPEETFTESIMEESVKEVSDVVDLTSIVGETEEKEPELTEDVRSIFEEFKKGLEAEVSEEDIETHYNLGIAYKEMGLIDDAIKEFQLTKNVPEKYISSMNMLAICYKEKSLYKIALDTLEEVLTRINKDSNEFLAIRYEMAEIYEKMGDLSKAFELYMEVFGIDSTFRDVSKKVEILRRSISPERAGLKQDKPLPPPPTRKDRISYI